MSESNNDIDHSILNLTDQEKRAYAYLFNQADSDQLGVVTGERAVSFFERTKVSPSILGEIWQIADAENRGLLTKAGFCMVLRLIGHYQAGKEPSAELAFKPAPIPRFEGLQIPGVSATPGPAGALPSPTGGPFPATALQPQLSGPGPIRVPPLDPQKAQQYAGLFERSGSQNGLLDGATAKTIFERAGLPNEVLGRIWTLSDREQRGALDQTEFIVAMHLLTSLKTRSMLALPSTLPQGLYEAAARRGVRPPSRQSTGMGAIPRQFTGGSTGAPPRTQSPVVRPPDYAAPPPQSAQTTGLPWLITPQEKAKYDQFFSTIDNQGRGVITGEQAVRFFSDSRLPEDTLASIWDLADINSEGQLNRDEFAVAMYLIRQQRAPNPPSLPAFLPPALVPPSMRQQQQSTQSTAPAFDNASNSSNLPKSAADDLFGLDEVNQPGQPQQPALQAQTTGTSAIRDPFGGSVPGSPSSPQRFHPSPQQSSVFKPFTPTSAFGATLAQQHTGGSTSSSQRGMQPQHSGLQSSTLQQASTSEDLLGDNETHAAESSKLTNESTELANMSNQIGNLRTQMESTQANKARVQSDLTTTNMQKRALEQRLQQFRAQYEQEVRVVKELEAQLAASREETKKLSQEVAMLDGSCQDLQSQHNSIAQQLQADQQENSNLKQKISQVNAEIARLKPEIEKMKMDARQQKGLVSINKKQLATNEGERDRLQREKSELEREATAREEAARNIPQQPEDGHFGRDAAIGVGVGAATLGGFEALEHRDSTGTGATPVPSSSNLASPASLGSKNPFFRKASQEESAVTSPATSGPTPSAFDALFGPSAAFAPTGQAGSRTGTPPATSFIGRNISATTAPNHSGMTDSVQSISSAGDPTPSATPPMSDATKESPGAVSDPPPPPEGRQFTPSQLPVGGLNERTKEGSEASSTRVIPPASRSGGVETPREFSSRMASPSPSMPGAFGAPTPAQENVPGAFPSEEQHMSTRTRQISEETPAFSQSQAKDDFDSAFMGFGAGDQAREASKNAADPFIPSSSEQRSKGFSSEFPPIETIESEDEDSSDDEEMHPGFEDNFNSSSPSRNTEAEVEQQTSENSAPNIAGAIPTVASVDSSASQTPNFSAQKSSTLQKGENLSQNEALLSSKNNSMPQPVGERSEQNVAEEVKDQQSTNLSASPTAVPGQSLTPGPQTPTTSDVFHDASSRPMSSVTDASQTPAQVTQPKNAFDEFDEFTDLSEAKEADKGENDFEFGFDSQHTENEFNPAFDSPAASMTTTMASSQQTPVPSNRGTDSNGFPNFHTSQGLSGPFVQSGIESSVQQSPQNAQHDWDAIFSGLDSSRGLDTSLGSASSKHDDPWSNSAPTNGTAEMTPKASSPGGSSTAKPSSKAAEMGRALTPGTEHDDPILKRLTGMGYPRADALEALEKYDYDINKAVDHLTSS
ncbi:hypothetical protein M433DRAFT_151259 [Acidomyces richmondensis BFW]|nr:MAG: hypothetical protein FE78DRAFT_85192 [Acidomyces sp. 'richmondensis']KYG48267.1 hypothetical protein M433DRAFT_151259 [Acidomyces richmondensis BFW]